MSADSRTRVSPAPQSIAEIRGYLQSSLSDKVVLIMQIKFEAPKVGHFPAFLTFTCHDRSRGFIDALQLSLTVWKKVCSSCFTHVKGGLYFVKTCL